MRNISKGPVSILPSTPRTAQGTRKTKNQSLNQLGIAKRSVNLKNYPVQQAQDLYKKNQMELPIVRIKLKSQSKSVRRGSTAPKYTRGEVGSPSEQTI